MRQPPKFYLQVNCSCYGCRRKFRKTIPEFQKCISNKYGLRRSNFDLRSGTLEIIEDVDENKLEELKVVFQEFTKKKDDTTFSCCFWTSKKKEGTASHEPQLIGHMEHLSIRDNNTNDFSKKPPDSEANHHHHHHQNQLQKQEQHPDANRKGKGIMEEGGKGNQQFKEIVLGGMNRNANNKQENDGANSKGKGIMGEDGQGRQQGKEIKLRRTGENMNQMGQNPRYETRDESNQMGQFGQYSWGEIPVNYQNDQRGQYPRGYTENHYGQTYHTNYMHPRSQMDGGYYRPQLPPYISPFSDAPTEDGGCSIM